MFRKFGYLALILGTTGVLLAACTGMNLNYSDNVNKVIAAAETITYLHPPKTFTPEFTVLVNDYTVVSYKPDQSSSHLYLLQSTDPDDAENLEDALAQIAPGAYDPKTRLEIIENQSVVVRGQETTLVISDGINGEGNRYRQAIVPFDGNGGPAMIIYITSINNWEPQVVYDLLSSIR